MLLTAWSRVPLEKVIVIQLVTKFPNFNGIRRFITVFTRSRHWSLSWIRWIQSIPYAPIFLRSIIILPSHLLLGLLSSFFLSCFAIKLLHYFSHLSHACYISHQSNLPWFSSSSSSSSDIGQWPVQIQKFNFWTMDPFGHLVGLLGRGISPT
jgi:hypothetical protein